MVQIARALCEVHKNNIIHLDIKPDNIFVDNGFFYLADFGLAKNLACQRDLNTIQEGDGKYCAKELLSDAYMKERMNSPQLLKKADIFSLGMIMLQLMMGNEFKLPLNGEQWNRIRNN